MPKIPLQKFAIKEFPMTPRSTLIYWANLGYYKHEGPLAGKITRIGGRWYINIPGDPIQEKILAQVKAMLGEKS